MQLQSLRRTPRVMFRSFFASTRAYQKSLPGSMLTVPVSLTTAIWSGRLPELCQAISHRLSKLSFSVHRFFRRTLCHSCATSPFLCLSNVVDAVLPLCVWSITCLVVVLDADHLIAPSTWPGGLLHMKTAYRSILIVASRSIGRNWTAPKSILPFSNVPFRA